jgi:hypothetical protein
MSRVAALSARLSTTFPGPYDASNAIDGSYMTLAASSEGAKGENYLAIQVPPLAVITTVALFNRLDYPVFQPWLGTVDVVRSDTEGETGSWNITTLADLWNSSTTYCGNATYPHPFNETMPYLVSCPSKAKGGW